MSDTDKSELDAKKLSEVYYQAIGVYPSSTNDMAGFKAIEDLITQQCNQARLDELECATVPDYFIWNKDGVSMTVGERKAELAQAKETEGE